MTEPVTATDLTPAAALAMLPAGRPTLHVFRLTLPGLSHGAAWTRGRVEIAIEGASRRRLAREPWRGMGYGLEIVDGMGTLVIETANREAW